MQPLEDIHFNENDYEKWTAYGQAKTANALFALGIDMKFAEKGDVDETLVRVVRGNVREPDQLIGDIYALATCNEIGHRRLIDMIKEFDLDDLNGIAEFILENSRRATLEAIAALPPPLVRGRRIKLRFAHPGGHNPPVIVIHGNQTEKLPDQYKRYLEKTFRRQLGLAGTPIRLEFKTTDNPYAGRKNKLKDKGRRGKDTKTTGRGLKRR